MKHLKHFHLLAAFLMLLLAFPAINGFFEGKDLLPIALGGLFVVLGLILLLIKRKSFLRYRISTFALLLVSILTINHLHFNVYSAKKKLQSEQSSMVLLKGKQAPAVTFVHQLNGHMGLNFSAHISKKQYTILNFWGTWCPPCLKEMPLLDEFYTKSGANVTVIGFTEYSRNPTQELQKIEELIEKLDISYPILIDSSTRVRAAYQADILPATVLLDQTGKVLDYQVGIEGATSIMNFVKENS